MTGCRTPITVLWLRVLPHIQTSSAAASRLSSTHPLALNTSALPQSESTCLLCQAAEYRCYSWPAILVESMVPSPRLLRCASASRMYAQAPDQNITISVLWLGGRLRQRAKRIVTLCPTAILCAARSIVCWRALRNRHKQSSVAMFVACFVAAGSSRPPLPHCWASSVRSSIDAHHQGACNPSTYRSTL